MTTPQHELYNISYKIDQLAKLFEPIYNDKDECIDDCIFVEVAEILDNSRTIVKRLERLEDQMALIIKLLSKDVSVG